MPPLALPPEGINPNGEELFFVSAGDEIVAIDVDTQNGLTIGQPHALFVLPDGLRDMINAGRDFIDITPDGQRFLMARQVNADAEIELVRVSNVQLLLDGRD